MRWWPFFVGPHYNWVFQCLTEYKPQTITFKVSTLFLDVLKMRLDSSMQCISQGHLCSGLFISCSAQLGGNKWETRETGNSFSASRSLPAGPEPKWPWLDTLNKLSSVVLCYLVEGMTDGGVPLHCYTDCQVDGAGHGDLSQGQDHAHQAEEPSVI